MGPPPQGLPRALGEGASGGSAIPPMGPREGANVSKGMAGRRGECLIGTPQYICTMIGTPQDMRSMNRGHKWRRTHRRFPLHSMRYVPRFTSMLSGG